MSRLLAAVAAVAARDPQRVAVACAGRRLTYADLARQAERLARALVRWPRLRLVAAEADQVAVALVAAEQAGASILLCDARGRPDEWDRAAGLFGVTHDLADSAVHRWPDVPGAGPAIPAAGPTVGAGGAAGSVPGATAAADTAAARGGLGLSSSGTQGLPKCVERPWPSVVANAAAFAAELGVDTGEVLACTAAPHHSYAVCAGLLTALVAGAGYVAVAAPAGPRHVSAAIDEQRVSVLLSVPLLYRWYAAGLPATRRPRLCLSAGAGLPEADRQRWAQTVGWLLGEHYGTSEHGMISVDTEGTPGCVGRPLAGVGVRLLVVDPAELPERADGEVAVRMPGPPAHLLAAPGRRLTALTGFCRTGDLATVEPDGRIYLLGRRGDVANIAGNKVSVAEVEAVIRQFPGVRDCAVVSVGGADGAPGHLRAFAEVDRWFDRAALRAFIRARLAAYKVPAVITSVDRLPRTSSGKIQRSMLDQRSPDRDGS